MYNKRRYKLFEGVPFPKNYASMVKKILSRLYRVFVHIYIHHFDKLVGLGAVSFLFSCSHFLSELLLLCLDDLLVVDDTDFVLNLSNISMHLIISILFGF